MKVGLVTCTPEKVEGFDLHVYYAKWANGSAFPAAKEMQNDVTCFCDAKAIRENPNIVAVSKNGPALRKNRRINLPFDFVCPTNEDYQTKVLDFIEGLGREKIQGVTLNLYHFPEEEFCVCPRCVELWRQSGLNWVEWRTETVINFIKEARKRVKCGFAAEIWPDPVLAKERFGLDFDQIAEYVDYFHLPLSARDYTTMYWVDMLTRDFIKILKKPVLLELSAEMPKDEKLDALLKTMAHVSRHDLKGILLLVHNSENARQVCRFAVKNSEFREWLKKHEFTEMSQIVENWATFY
jgi:hypothetical protein